MMLVTTLSTMRAPKRLSSTADSVVATALATTAGAALDAGATGVVATLILATAAATGALSAHATALGWPTTAYAVTAPAPTIVAAEARRRPISDVAVCAACWYVGVEATKRADTRPRCIAERRLANEASGDAAAERRAKAEARKLDMFSKKLLDRFTSAAVGDERRQEIRAKDKKRPMCALIDHIDGAAAASDCVQQWDSPLAAADWDSPPTRRRNDFRVGAAT
jgi:hypothetical protein